MSIILHCKTEDIEKCNSDLFELVQLKMLNNENLDPNVMLNFKYMTIIYACLFKSSCRNADLLVDI